MSTSWYLLFSWWRTWLTFKVMAWPGHMSEISRNHPSGTDVVSRAAIDAQRWAREQSRYLWWWGVWFGSLRINWVTREEQDGEKAEGGEESRVSSSQNLKVTGWPKRNTALIVGVQRSKVCWNLPMWRMTSHIVPGWNTPGWQLRICQHTHTLSVYSLFRHGVTTYPTTVCVVNPRSAPTWSAVQRPDHDRIITFELYQEVRS